MLGLCRSSRMPIWRAAAHGRVPKTPAETRRAVEPGVIVPIAANYCQHLGADGVLPDRMHEHLTRREALVAALAAATLGSGALARPAISRAAATARIGLILPFSKPGDTVAGNNVLKTVQLWVDWVNGRGGVDGQHLALSTYDDKADPNRAVKQFERAVMHDHCAVVLAGWDSRVARAEVEQAHKLQTPMFVSYAWSPDITKLNYPEVVRIGPNNDMSASAFAPFLKARGYRNVTLLADDAALGQDLGPAIRVTAVAAGIDVAAHEFKRDTEDLRPKLKTIMARNPDALGWLPGPSPRPACSRSPRHGQPATRATSCSAGTTSTRPSGRPRARAASASSGPPSRRRRCA